MDKTTVSESVDYTMINQLRYVAMKENNKHSSQLSKIIEYISFASDFLKWCLAASFFGYY